MIPSTKIKYYSHHKFVFLWGDRSLGQGKVILPELEVEAIYAVSLPAPLKKNLQSLADSDVSTATKIPIIFTQKC